MNNDNMLGRIFRQLTNSLSLTLFLRLCLSPVWWFSVSPKHHVHTAHQPGTYALVENQNHLKKTRDTEWKYIYFYMNDEKKNERWNNKQITKPIYATDLNSLETISSANKEQK